MSNTTDWLAWLEAEPRCEPDLSIAAQWKADKARLAEAMESHGEACRRMVAAEARLAEAIECCTIKDNRNLWLEIRLKKIMARCADLLDEDQFNELDAMVTSQPSRAIIQQAKECGCGICDACVAAPAQKTLTDLAREMNYQPSRYEAHLEARLAEADALLREARAHLDNLGNKPDLKRRIDAHLAADSASGGA